jgi:UDP-N-acetylmuramyl pentapeptide phosphotransferase/UDP-N-acetylglucosamine-1-phosphate transferase
MNFLLYNEALIPLEAFLLAFLITYLTIPSVVDVAKLKNLYAVPNERTSHQSSIPTLGGFAVFSGFIVSVMIFAYIPNISYLQYIVAGMLVVFLLGLKDDVIQLSPMTKIVGEILAATIIIDLGNVRITGLYGFMGVSSIGPYSSDLLSIFVIIAIVNAFNLIDGIDGLASGVGIIAGLTFGFWFYIAGYIQLAILAFSLVGALIAFFGYNVFSVKNKIFMGDIGSLVLGFMMSIFAIKFNELNLSYKGELRIFAAPAVSIGILIVPIFDTIRVFTLRMIKGRSPFSADRQHVHHYVVDLVGSHKKATAIILSVNIAFIVVAILLSDLRNYQLTLILLALAAICSAIPFFLLKRRNAALAKNT